MWYNLRGIKWAQIDRQTLERILDRTAHKAGFKKNIYPHLFRHSRLTELAPKIPEQALKAFAGWGQDSRMAAVYIHMSNKHVDDALAKAHGIELDEETIEDKLAPKNCPRCKEKNPSTAKFCFKCSMILDIKTALELQETKEKDDQTVKTMVERMVKMQQTMKDLFEEIDDLREQKTTMVGK